MSGEALAAEKGWCTFTVADGLYGVELPSANEVLRPQPLTRVPLAPPALAGLLNLRGQIVPAIDLRALFRLPPRDAGGGGMVVVRGADGPVALVVDAIGDVRRAPEVESLDAELGGETSSDPLFVQVLALPERLLVVLDLDNVLEAAFARPGLGTRESRGDGGAGSSETPLTPRARKGPAPPSPGDRS